MTEPGAATPDVVAALGPFFAFSTHARDSAVSQPWRLISELVRDPGVLPDRVASVRGYLAAAGGRPPEAVELRVAASVTHLGLVARLLSPALALGAVQGTPPAAFDLLDVRWQPSLGGAFALSLPREALAPAGRTAAGLLDGPIRELADAMTPLSVSPRVLWGNVASAVNGAASAVAASTPALSARMREVADLVLEQPPLRAAHTRAKDNGRFRRRSCCLIYRAAPNAAGALCGDCVLSGRRCDR